MLSRLLGFLVLASAIGLSSAGYRADSVAAAQSDSATGTAAGVLSRTNALASWNDGPAKKELLYFLWRVTRDGGPDFVPEDARIAVFDNDGNLWSEQPMYYGIPPEQVVGSSGKTKFELRGGRPVLLRLPEVEFVDDREGKPAGIYRFIGRRPILAFGNSDGDLEMLQWTAGGTGARFIGLLHHTDAVREVAYDRRSPIEGWTRPAIKPPQGGGPS